MPEYTQENQPLKIHTDLPDDTLLLTRLEGEEAISRPFRFGLDLVSTDPGIDGRALLRTPAHITFPLDDGSERSIHGRFRRFAQTGMRDDLVSYRAEIVPWPWFLTLRSRRRVFRDASILDIAEEIFGEWGYADFDVRCGGRATREYVVQYDESDWDFVSRWLEAEGIFYFFEHSEAGHVLVLADGNGSIPTSPGIDTAWFRGESEVEEDAVTSFVREHQVEVGRVALRDYDYLQPSFSLDTALEGDEPVGESYEYPGVFTDLDDGERYARYRLEAREARLEEVDGSGSCRWMISGHTFELDGHFNPDSNGEYIVTAVRHECENPAYRAGGGAREGMDYRNSFHCIPSSVPFRPIRATPWPSVRGSHTAVVVGPSGEDVWVDEHGRVRIQFHWDREGAGDENSSCPVRVSSPWSGKGWGYQQVPRIGHEVIVDFVEGDPDRPIITGRVHNAENTPPLESPANASRSIMRDYADNEIVLEGKEGEEQVRLFSPFKKSRIHLGSPDGKNVEIHTEGDRKDFTQGNLDETVNGDVSSTVAGNVTNHVTQNFVQEVKGSKDETIFKPVNEFKLSVKNSFVIGLENSTFVGGKTANSLSYEVKNTLGKSIEANEKGKKVTSNTEIFLGYQDSSPMDSLKSDVQSLKAGAKSVKARFKKSSGGGDGGPPADSAAGDDPHIRINKDSILLKVGDTAITMKKKSIVIETEELSINTSKGTTVKDGKRVTLEAPGVKIPKGKFDFKHAKA